jgi:predicted PurR-regulated permease PerM
MPAAASPSAVSRNAMVILAVIAVGAAMYWLSPILTPLALAMFLAVMIDGFSRVLKRRAPRLSGRGATALAIVLSLAVFSGSVFFIAENAATFASQLVAYAPKLNSVIARLAGLFGIDAPPSVQTLLRQLDPSKYVGLVAREAQNFLSNAAYVLVYLGFILASRAGFERKIVGLFPVREERHEAMAAFMRIRDSVEQYLWVQTLTGLMHAGLAYAVMAVVGLDNALLWAFLIFIASYIPIIGAFIGVAGPPIFALVQFPTYWQAIVLFGVLQTGVLIIGNIIYPRMQGRSLNIDPVVVLLALAFWSAIWGLAGAFLSTPLTVAIMVILAQFEGTRWISVLLSADGEPEQLKNKPAGQAPEASASKTSARKTPGRRNPT